MELRKKNSIGGLTKPKETRGYSYLYYVFSVGLRAQINFSSSAVTAQVYPCTVTSTRLFEIVGNLLRRETLRGLLSTHINSTPV